MWSQIPRFHSHTNQMDEKANPLPFLTETVAKYHDDYVKSVELRAILRRQEETIKRIKDHTCRICDQEFPCYSRRPTSCQCRHDPVCFDCSEKLYTTHRYKLYESQDSCRMCRHHGRDCTHIPAEKDIYRLMRDLYVDTHTCYKCKGKMTCRKSPVRNVCTCIYNLTSGAFLCQTCYHRQSNGLRDLEPLANAPPTCTNAITDHTNAKAKCKGKMQRHLLQMQRRNDVSQKCPPPSDGG